MFSHGLIASVLLASLAPVGGDEGQPLSQEQLTEFLGPGVTSSMTWTVMPSVDFVVYRGQPQPPLTGGVGIYLGGHPSRERDPSSVIVRGQLGIFPVKWYRTVSPKGEIRQEAVVPLDVDEDYLKAHVWIEAERQADFDKLLGEVSRLPTFSFKHVSPFHDDVVIRRRARAVAFVICPLLFGGSVWWLDRLLRRRKASAVQRGLAMAGVSVGWMLLVRAFALLPEQLVNLMVHYEAQWAVLVILGLGAISLIAGLLIAGISFTRRRLAQVRPV